MISEDERETEGFYKGGFERWRETGEQSERQFKIETLEGDREQMVDL